MVSKKLQFIIVFLVCILPILGAAENVEFTKSDAIILTVSAYVHGFKEFDTSVIASDDSVSVGIYFDLTTQENHRAEMLAKRFRIHIPGVLSKYKWAKDVKVIVTVYSEDRTGRGY
jgi:hypothetical protein